MIGTADDHAQLAGGFQPNYRKVDAVPWHGILEVAACAILLERQVNVDAGLAQLDEIRSGPKRLRDGLGCVAAEPQPGFIHLDESVTWVRGRSRRAASSQMAHVMMCSARCRDCCS